MSAMRYGDVRHNCDLPSTEHLPDYGARHQVMARWRCPECGARWAYEANFLSHDRMRWERRTRPSRRWARRERQRLASLEGKD